MVGDTGVGKTEVVKNIALLIEKGEVPDSLKNKTILSLSLGDLSSGTSLRGSLETKITELITQIKDNGNYILYIDNIPSLIGNSAVSDLLKPALNSGIVKCIGTASIEDSKKFRKDRGLASMFEVIDIPEPTSAETISILRGVKHKYETYHKVSIRDSALISAVKLSGRYITDKFWPAKAIELIDQACSALKCEMDMEPRVVAQIRHDILAKKGELSSIEKEIGAEEAKSKLEIKIAELEEILTIKLAQWANERSMVEALDSVLQKISDWSSETNSGEEFEALRDKKYSIIKDLAESRKTGIFVREEVSELDVGSVISRMTGIPMENMGGDEEKLLCMAEKLGESVIGQKPAIDAISNAVRLSRAGLADSGQPIGSFIFLGPTGTGKTELAKALAGYLFDDVTNMVRIDTSEFQGKETVNKLIGSPAGFSGSDDGGMLTEAVLRKPYSVVLFDEIDKAHPDIFDLLLQVLDDGRLTDGRGRVVDFKNTLIIMTSNIGARHVIDGEVTPEIRELVLQDLGKKFRPEFLNRFNSIEIFHRLGREHIAKIVGIQLKKLHKQLAEKKLTLNLTDAAIELICEEGYDPAFGARPLKRAIQTLVQIPLTFLILSKKVKAGDTITMDRDGKKLSVV